MKNKFFKRLAACACVTALVAGTMGCGGQKGNEEGRTAAVDAEEAEEPVTYEFFFNIGYAPEYPEDGGEAKKIILEAMEKAGIKNVDFNVTLAGGEEYFTKLNMLAASDSLPDYFDVNDVIKEQFADQGYIMPVDDLLNKMPSYTAQMNASDMEQIKYKGQSWVLPAVRTNDFYNGVNTDVLVIRTDWMEKLSLKEPQTLDELHDVLKAFAENDPDGNGKKDTYGMGTWKDDYFSYIQGAFGIKDTYWFERDGKLKPGFCLPEMKDCLSLLAQWYSEGLISPDFPLMEREQLREQFINNQVGIKSEVAYTFTDNDNNYINFYAANPDGKFGMIPFPEGTDKKKGTGKNFSANETPRAINANVKRPETLAKILDWSSDMGPDGGGMLLTYGIEGEHYVYDKETNMVDEIVPAGEKVKLGYSNPVRFVKVVDRRWVKPEGQEVIGWLNNPENGNLIENAFWGTVPAMSDYPDIYTPGQLPKLWQEYFVKIVTGELPVDAFDEYVQKFYAQGGQELEDQVNTAYQEMNK